MAKLKLSDTMQLLSGKFQTLTGLDVGVVVEMETARVRPGGEVRAKARVASPGKDRRLDHLLISLTGQVQRDGKWRDYVQSAEVAHETPLLAEKEFVVPVVVHNPSDAVLSEDGGTWSLFARAYISKTSDPKDRAEFVVAVDAGQD